MDYLSSFSTRSAWSRTAFQSINVPTTRSQKYITDTKERLKVTSGKLFVLPVFDSLNPD